MLRGTIDAVGQIYLPIELIPASGGRATFQALLDTGFTGSIGIRRALATIVQWQPHGYVEAALAHGSEALQLMLGQVIFDGRQQRVRAVMITSDDLIIGLSLLRDKRLVVDFRTGEVALE